MKRIFLTLMAIVSLNYLAESQINTPAASPGAKVTQTIGLTDVTVEYSRPSAKTRTIFAEDGLVPYGKMWRTGANSATKITFTDDVKVLGNELVAGSYAILTMPDANQWTVNFYPYDKGNWGSYVDMTPTASVMVKPKRISDFTESFEISFEDLGTSYGDMVFKWENTSVAVKLWTDVDTKVMKNIESVMAGPSVNDYYNAATYYHTSGKDLNQALAWVQKATKVAEPKFWQVRREALILGDLGKVKEAIAAATLSKELAMKAGNDEYVKMNEESIKAWSMK